MRILFLFLWILVIAPCASRSQTHASKELDRCGKSKFENNCLKLLPPTDYIYLASWDFKSNESLDPKFSVLLKRNILYVFTICEGAEEGDMEINLFNDDDKLLVSSINKKTKKNDKIIYFRPTISGKFYITTLFKKDEANCCLVTQLISGIKNFKKK